jgi:hypothetical protein
MTIAVGFLCPDGVVIGADRRIAGHALTFAESKLDRFDWSDGRAIMGYSGDRDTWIKLKENLHGSIVPSLSLDGDGFRDLLKKILRSTLGRKEAFCTLCGYWKGGDNYYLLKTDGDSIVPISSTEIIGWGNSALSRYMMQRYEILGYRSVKQALIYAANFISQAERYDGQYIGNGAEAYCLQRIDGWGQEPGGKVGVRILTPSRAEEYQKHVDIINHWMDVLFGQMTDSKRPLELDEFIAAVQRFRLWTSGSEEFTLSGFQR